MAYDIFISYRRNGGSVIARQVQLLLENHGYKVFFDLDECNAASWEKRIKAGVEESRVFLFIMTKGSLNECDSENDPVRKEIEYAYQLHKEIIQVNPDREFGEKDYPQNCPTEVREALGAHTYYEIFTGQQLKNTVGSLVKDRIMPIVEPDKKVETGACIHLCSDMDCQVKWYDKPLCALEAGKYKDVYLEKGDHVLTAISVENPLDRLDKEFTIETDNIHKKIFIKLTPVREARLTQGRWQNYFEHPECISSPSAPPKTSSPRRNTSWLWVALVGIAVGVSAVLGLRGCQSHTGGNPDVTDSLAIEVIADTTLTQDEGRDAPLSREKSEIHEIAPQARETADDTEKTKLEEENRRLREKIRQDSIEAVKQAEAERQAQELAKQIAAEEARKAREEAERKKAEQARVSSTSGYINGHEWVDLGLSVKWATCNVGASSSEEYGDYFAWGETSTKVEYTRENSVTQNKPFGDISGNARYDAARANWGGSWRMPTQAECQELAENCSWTSIMLNGVKGCKLISKKNGCSIFLPATGSIFDGAGTNACYWGATPKGWTTDNTIMGACVLFFNSYYGVNWCERYMGFPIRPVCD